MTKSKTNKRRYSRLGRIESKCDRILSELIIIRHNLSRPDIDATIDRLHSAARKMRAQCEVERNTLRRLFNSNKKE